MEVSVRVELKLGFVRDIEIDLMLVWESQLTLFQRGGSNLLMFGFGEWKLFWL